MGKYFSDDAINAQIYLAYQTMNMDWHGVKMAEVTVEALDARYIEITDAIKNYLRTGDISDIPKEFRYSIHGENYKSGQFINAYSSESVEILKIYSIYMLLRKKITDTLGETEVGPIRVVSQSDEKPNVVVNNLGVQSDICAIGLLDKNESNLLTTLMTKLEDVAFEYTTSYQEKSIAVSIEDAIWQLNRLSEYAITREIRERMSPVIARMLAHNAEHEAILIKEGHGFKDRDDDDGNEIGIGC